MRHVVMMYVWAMYVVAMVVGCDSGKVRLYRKHDHRLSTKSKTITVWYTQRSDVRSGDMVYIDIPMVLVLGYECSIPGAYKLKGSARRYAQYSWKGVM
jgi:hypothetical protein